MKTEKEVTKTVKPILWGLALMTALSVVPDRAAQAHEYGHSPNVTIIWSNSDRRANPYPDIPPQGVIAVPTRVFRSVAPVAQVYYPAYYYVWTPRGWVERPLPPGHAKYHHSHHRVDNRDNSRRH